MSEGTWVWVESDTTHKQYYGQVVYDSGEMILVRLPGKGTFLYHRDAVRED